MPELIIKIGGRDFPVACQEGEEPFLQSAAAMLDNEAAVILGQVGRMPAERMLLMAGLMLADKTAALEEDLLSANEKLAQIEQTLTAAEERLADRSRRIAELEQAAPPAQVTVIPDQVTDGLSELAARAEALAERLEADSA